MTFDNERYMQDIAEHHANVHALAELKGADYVEKITTQLRDADRGEEVPQAIARHLAHAKADAREASGWGSMSPMM